jgi:hypothetical protein
MRTDRVVARRYCPEIVANKTLSRLNTSVQGWDYYTTGKKEAVQMLGRNSYRLE